MISRINDISWYLSITLLAAAALLVASTGLASLTTIRPPEVVVRALFAVNALHDLRSLAAFVVCPLSSLSTLSHLLRWLVLLELAHELGAGHGDAVARARLAVEGGRERADRAARLQPITASASTKMYFETSCDLW